jgi:hypothetical protein
MLAAQGAPQAAPVAGVLLGAVLAALAGFFLVRGLTEPDRLPEGLGEEDRAYYRRRRVRRGVGSGLMALIGAAIVVLSLIDGRRSVETARALVWGWIAVLGLLVGLLVVGALDWSANTRFALRQRRALLTEQREYMADLARRRARERGGRGRFGDPSVN